MKTVALILSVLFSMTGVYGQRHHLQEGEQSSSAIPSQTLLAHALRLADALQFLGSPLHDEDERKLRQLQHTPPGPEVSEAIQQMLDSYCLASVHINPEARVKVARGPAEARLIQNGWTSYLVKVSDEAGVTATLVAESPQSEPPLFPSAYKPVVDESRKFSPGQVADRFLAFIVVKRASLFLSKVA